MTGPIKPVQPVRKVYAQAKRPIGPVCLACAGYGYVQDKTKSGGRPQKRTCYTCKGKGRIGG